MKTLSAILILLSFVACTERKPPVASAKVTVVNDDTLVKMGRIIRVEAANAGSDVAEGKRLVQTGDYYFLSGGDSLFVKISECTVPRERINTLLNKVVMINCQMRTGSLDSTIQSRGGQYIAITSIKRWGDSGDD